MSSPNNKFVTPAGRFISGSVYEPETKDAQGNLRLVKSGPNAGKPNPQYLVGIAIPKAGEQHWAHTSWGKVIWDNGHLSFPRGEAQRPDFAWKITDGDSTVPNSNGKVPRDNPNYVGCWVLWCASSFAPVLCNADGSQHLLEPDAILPGYYIQVMATVTGNGNSQKPGVFLNVQAVARTAYGERIVGSIDTKNVGFGNGVVLPAGASQTPIGAMAPPAGTTPPPAGTTPPPAGTTPPPAGTTPPPAGTMVPPAGTTPPPAPQPTVAATPSYTMTAAAGNTSREAYHAAGWTDEQLIAHGLMVVAQGVAPYPNILK